MIKSIQGGRYVQVVGGVSPVPYISPGSQSAGMMRYNTNSQNIEVYDGVGWQAFPNDYVTVALNADAESLLDWARQERDRQYQREQLIKDKPHLQKALDAIKRAEENFDILATLSEEQASVV